jgi:hypothetical protein
MNNEAAGVMAAAVSGVRIVPPPDQQKQISGASG